jgi:hypothetical protein
MDVSQRVTQQPHLQKVPLKFRQRLQSWHRPITEVYFPKVGLPPWWRWWAGRQAEVAITGREGMSGLPIALGTDGSPQRGAGDRLTGARRVRSGSTGLTCVCQGQSRGGQRQHRGVAGRTFRRPGVRFPGQARHLSSCDLAPQRRTIHNVVLAELTSRGRSCKTGSMYRLLLAGLIAVAVALAPIGAALAASSAMSKAPMQDCHGKKTIKEHSCCDKMAKTPDQCGIKCCKLIGMVVTLSAIEPPTVPPPEEVQPQKPPDWRLRPRPPPPRS